LRQFALLIQQIALCDQDHAVIGRKGRDSRTRMGQKLDWMAQHLAPRRQNFGDDGRCHAALCHLDRGFDHRQHKAFDAKPVVPKIAPFCRFQPLDQMRRVRIAQQFGEALLCQAKERFVLPQRIVRSQGPWGPFMAAKMRYIEALGNKTPFAPEPSFDRFR
jgi:hypothetical protein